MKEKFKKIDLKKVLKIFSILWFLALIVLMTLFNLGYDEKFVFTTWVGNFLILVGIMVFGLLMGESVGADKQIEKVNGLYQTSLYAYNAFIATISDILIYFMQFFQWFMGKELFDKKVNYLVTNNVDVNKARLIVKYCNLKDLEELSTHTIEKIDEEGNKFFIRQLDEAQYNAAKEVISGKIKLDSPEPNYYLSAFGKSNSKSILEAGKQLDHEIKFSKNANRALKIGSSLVISLLFAMLTTKEMKDGYITQAYINLVFRITALITSLVSGWLSSVMEIRLQAEKIDNKLKVLKMFKSSLDNKLFIPKNEDELAKIEYDEYLKNSTNK